MNLLEQAIRSYRLDELKTMNSLQLAGVVSDNCVLACDVAPADCERAVAAMEKIFNTQRFTKKEGAKLSTPELAL